MESRYLWSRLQPLQDTYQTVKIKEVGKKKEESPFDILYSPQSYDIKTQTNQKNKLVELEEKKEFIKVTISEPKLEKSTWNFLGFWGNSKNNNYNYSNAFSPDEYNYLYLYCGNVLDLKNKYLIDIL